MRGVISQPRAAVRLDSLTSPGSCLSHHRFVELSTKRPVLQQCYAGPRIHKAMRVTCAMLLTPSLPSIALICVRTVFNDTIQTLMVNGCKRWVIELTCRHFAMYSLLDVHSHGEMVRMKSKAAWIFFPCLTHRTDAKGKSNRNPRVTYELLAIGCDVMRQPLLRGSIISSSRL